MLRSFLLIASTSSTTVWGLSLPSPTSSPQSTSNHNSFVVAQYNVLAGTLGANTHPWFLHGLTSLTNDRRSAIMSKFYRRDATTGKLLKIGWPDHAEGILTDEERRVVEDFDQKYFAWDVRKTRLLRTIQEINADLISLVECDQYDTFWEKEMDRLGYGGIYKQRPRRGCSDGCAIFFRRGVFDIEAYQGVELIDKGGGNGGRGAENGEKDEVDDRPISRIGDTADRVALLALVRHAPTGRRLIFVSTHLARNPECPLKTNERVRQVAQILYHITLFAAEHQEGEGEPEAPVVLAGDLNEANLWHLGTMARIKCGVADMGCHPFTFTSKAASSQPTPTSITSCRSMRIDYILLQPSLLQVVESMFEMGQDKDHGEQECRIMDQDEVIPNERHPSDHLPVAFRVKFRDRQSVAEGCAASWAEILGENPKQQGKISTVWPTRPGGVLSLEEMEVAFNYFDRNGDGVCDREELSCGVKRLRLSGSEMALETILQAKSSLTLDEFRALYMKSWLRQQRCFFDRVRSVRTMFHLTVESTNFSSAAAAGEAGEKSGNLFEEMDVDGDGIVTVEEVIDHLAMVEKSEDSLRTRIADAFSFFDFDSGNKFSMQELHQCFVDACPFEVSTDVLQVAFDDMGKSSNERIELDELIDWFIRRYFRKDIGWISLVGPIPK